MTILTTPKLRAKVDGQPIGQDLASSLLSVVIRQRLNRPTLCEMVFAVGHVGHSRPRFPEQGQELLIHLGDAVAPVFGGKITTIEERYTNSGCHELHVSSFDALHTLRLRQPLRVFEDCSCAELTEQLVEGSGLAVAAHEPGPRIERIVQYRQTDHDLLEEVCSRVGISFFARGNSLHLLPASGSGERVTRKLGEDVLQLRVTRDHAVAACGNVEAHGFEVDGAEKVMGAYYQDDVPDTTSAAFDGTWKLAGETVADSEEACYRATAIHDRHDAERHYLVADVEGNPDLRPGVTLALEGLQAGGVHEFVLTAVEHRVDLASGYVCSVCSRPPAIPECRARQPIVTFADVLAIDDPKNRGRVRAKLPAFGDLETDWMAVTVPAAGDGKGLCALPDVGDRVVVLFPDQDLAYGIVLGSVFGKHSPPEPGAPQSRFRHFTFTTAGGQSVHLDDERLAIRVEDKNGSHLELGPVKTILHSMVDLEIKAPGKHILIQADQIDVERG